MLNYTMREKVCDRERNAERVVVCVCGCVCVCVLGGYIEGRISSCGISFSRAI